MSIQHAYFIISRTTLFFFIDSLIGGTIWDHNEQHSYKNESVNVGDEWSMEVDLRSEEKEKRTLHWFVRGKQQKGFIKGVPDRVEFGV